MLLKTLFGSHNDRELKRLWPRVEQVNAHATALSALSDTALREKTEAFRKQLSDGSPDDLELAQRLSALLPEAFAVAREAAGRVLGMRHFDVQLLGGMALHEGKIAEMKTGEGKTLVATLPVYLNALAGRGVHVITVNDYLARRDAQWMGELYRFLGLSVGLIQHDLPDRERQIAYGSDVTYGTNNEFGFDYLRDNMKFDPARFVQRELFYANVDEVDSILIDEARTPLIISGPAEDSTDLYYRINRIIPSLKQDADYTIEEKSKTVALTDDGNAKVESLLGVSNLYDLSNITLVHHALQALRAHTLYKLDVDYMIKDGEVIIVDEFTGRLMPGRRWSDGLHQAVEAKEGVRIANENQTLASITFQNYFRLYKKLSGMTGTADTEATEFSKIYNLEVLVAPPNRKMIRSDEADVIYRTVKEKVAAIVEEVIELQQRGQPVLVGTISIEKSEQLSLQLKRRGIPHAVLNAKYHEREAEIIAQAGRKGAVTIATNMAGRGTDILLGGNPDFLFKQYQAQHPDAEEVALAAAKAKVVATCEAEKLEVIALGGLHIIGTERHESRRIDNQLRGRSGRQGDPGSSRFYLSMEDDLLRIFGSERISNLMARMGMEEGEPIVHRMVTRAIENAQKKVESHNFDIRKQLLEYDDVMNKQRIVIYDRRREVLSSETVEEDVRGFVAEQVEAMLAVYCPEGRYSEGWDADGLVESLGHQLSLHLSKEDMGFPSVGRESLKETLLEQVQAVYQKKEAEFGAPILRQMEQQIFLRTIDSHWKDHLLAMDQLKEGIGLRGYGQKEPLTEYKREGYDMFEAMIDRIKSDTIATLLRVQMVKQAPAPPPRIIPMQMNRGEVLPHAAHRPETKVGRNDPCPCGSGQKYKKCCGK
jgi:preprotein translocase subunit SecA